MSQRTSYVAACSPSISTPATATHMVTACMATHTTHTVTACIINACDGNPHGPGLPHSGCDPLVSDVQPFKFGPPVQFGQFSLAQLQLRLAQQNSHQSNQSVHPSCQHRCSNAALRSLPIPKTKQPSSHAATKPYLKIRLRNARQKFARLNRRSTAYAPQEHSLHACSGAQHTCLNRCTAYRAQPLHTC